MVTESHTPTPLRRFVVAMALGWLIFAGMGYWLVDYAGVWTVLANTRFLSVLIDFGVVAYTDAGIGIIEGVPDHGLYVMSQDPVNPTLILIGVALYVGFWLAESWRFREALRFTGVSLPQREAERAYFVGTHYGRWFPLRFRDATIEEALAGKVSRDELGRTFAALDVGTVVFQVAIFLIWGFATSGFGTTVLQSLPGFAILVVAWLVVRGAGIVSQTPSGGAASPRRSLAVFWKNVVAVLASPQGWWRIGGLAALAMLLDDIAPYVLAQAFTSEHVILSVPFLVIQGAVVSGYLAKQIAITPKGIGQYEVGFALSLYVFGVGLPEAATIAILDSAVRNSVGLVFGIVARRRSDVTFGAVLRRYLTSAAEGDADAAAPSRVSSAASAVVPFAAPRLPDLGRIATGMVWIAWVVVALLCLDSLAFLLMDYWLLDQLGFSGVFWTNFEMGAWLFTLGLALSLVPLHPVIVGRKIDPGLRRILLHVTLMGSLAHAFAFSDTWFEMLMSSGASFGYVDPVFGHDASFYAFTLPSIEAGAGLALRIALATLVNWVIAAWLARPVGSGGELPADGSTTFRPVVAFIGALATRGTRIALLATMIVLAFMAWLTRFDVLFMDNTRSSVFTGASYVDAEGLFSTINSRAALAVALLGLGVVLFVALGRLHRSVVHGAPAPAAKTRRLLWRLALAFTVLATAFPLLVRLRHAVSVSPDEPVVQLPYIAEHIRATRMAYGFDTVETKELLPASPADPMPSRERILGSAMAANIPLWPGFASYLENLIDPQHAERLQLTGGDTLIYGPLLDVLRQQQQLRPYYGFLDVDNLRYDVGGEQRLLVSSVREVPLVEPQPWLAWWGQRFMLFTHGLGLVAVDAAAATSEGLPRFVAGGLPAASEVPALAQPQQRIYYGEGAGSIAYTNVQHMKELDYSNREEREEIWFPTDVDAGVHIDSLVKRLVFAYVSGQVFQILFSDLITDETRAHYFRAPLERVKRIAPFLYYDTDPFAFTAGGRVQWMVNGITWTSRFPFSQRDELGDKSDSRSRTLYGHIDVNYARDAVKVVIDAFDGKTTFYKLRSEPIADTLEAIYPDLFTPIEHMPAAARAQMQYPAQLYHLLFDNLYILYQMKDPMTFFNMEDMWDDADEVLGPILDEGHAIRFSMEPFNVVLDADDAPFPRTRGGGKTQFALTMAFTPEGGAHNLRAFPVIYQDGDDYGRVIVLQVPKGHFALGPEQADTIIDQEPRIAQEFTLWTRLGVEVIRGHTSMIVVDREVIWVEPIFLRSLQDPMPMLKRVIVVFRGVARSGTTLAEALDAAMRDYAAKP